MVTWIVYYTNSDRIKATFTDEKKARAFHKEQGGDLVKKDTEYSFLEEVNN